MPEGSARFEQPSLTVDLSVLVKFQHSPAKRSGDQHPDPRFSETLRPSLIPDQIVAHFGFATSRAEVPVSQPNVPSILCTLFRVLITTAKSELAIHLREDLGISPVSLQG
ncbi:unnamed protein product [Penicillium bialowiezense]